MFKKNTAVTGFGIGHFINTTTGAAVTTGTPTCKRTIDGTGGACANAASYNSDGAVWEIDLADTDMNGSVIILSFTLTDCLPISYTIKTSQVDVDDAVHFGITALPNATPGSNGGLPTTNGSKLNQTADLTAGQEIDANLTKIGGVAQSATDLKDFADSGYDPSTHKVQGVVLADTATTLTNLPAVTADWLTAAGVKADAVAKIQNGLATPTNITAGTITTVTNLTNAPTNGDLTATMKTSVQTAADAAVTANTKIVAIEADTNEVQAELADGGRTDLLIDAIKAITDQINFTGTDVNANASVALTEGDISDIADGVAAAIKLTTGWTAGGTLTYAEVVKIIASAVAGKVIDKAGVAGTIQHLDVEDGVTAIFENVPSNTTSPYRDPTIL